MLDFFNIIRCPSLIERTLLAVFLAAGSLVLSGCGSNPYPPVPEPQRDVLADYHYVVGPGDSMQIFVWGNPELSGGAKVRPDGKMTTRLVEDLVASGRTSTELAREIERVYSEYVRQPVVSVIVGGFVGVPTQQVRVVGEATSPKGIPFREHMTLLDLMIDVGGMTKFAAGNKAVLIRLEDGRQVSYGLRIDDLIKDGDISANLAMMPGDIIIIPESWF